MTSSSDLPPDIKQLRQQFAQLERPTRPRSTRDVILHELMPEIEKKLSRGWRYADIVVGLREVGISVNASTLRNYVATARQGLGTPSASTQPRSSKRISAAASKHTENASAPSAELPARTATTETTHKPAIRLRRRTQKTAFAGFDETP